MMFLELVMVIEKIIQVLQIADLTTYLDLVQILAIIVALGHLTPHLLIARQAALAVLQEGLQQDLLKPKDRREL